MIKTPRQRQITMRHAAELDASIAEAKTKGCPFGIQPATFEGFIRGMQGMAADLRAQVALHDKLVAGDERAIRLADWADLPLALIQYRILRHKSQSELAAEMGVSPQQVQRWEAMDNQTASFTTLCEMARVLKVPFPVNRTVFVELRTTRSNISTLGSALAADILRISQLNYGPGISDALALYEGAARALPTLGTVGGIWPVDDSFQSYRAH